jgi:hypothetical protein
MKRLWSGVIMAIAAATVGLGAQGAPGSQSSSPAQGAQERDQGRPATPSGSQKIIVTGCLQDAPAATPATGATGTRTEGARASASAGVQNFVLTNAKMGSGAGSAGRAVGTSGTATSRYELDGDEKTLSGHLDHQVEVTGMLESSSTASPGAGAGSPSASAAAPKLKVDAVKMISAKCM